MSKAIEGRSRHEVGSFSVPLERSVPRFGRAACVAGVVVALFGLGAPAHAQEEDRSGAAVSVQGVESTATNDDTTPSRVGGGFFTRNEVLSAPAAAYHRFRFDFGMRIRPLEHLAIDIGIGVGGGRMRRPSGQDRVTEIGLAVDVLGYLNPRSTAQFFVLGGVGLGSAGSSEQVGEVDPECPSDAMFFADVSIGAGLEVALNDTVSLIGATRLVRRTAFAGELELLSDSTNPPDQPLRHVLAVAAELRLILYFGPTPPAT